MLSLWREVFEEHSGGSLEFRALIHRAVSSCLTNCALGWANGVWTKGQIVALGEEKNGWSTYLFNLMMQCLIMITTLAGVLFTITDISDQRLYEASQLLHAQEREATARRRAEEAEDRRKEADERRRGQGISLFIPF